MSSHVPPDFASTHFLSEGHLGLDLLNSEHFDYRGRHPPQDLLEHPAWLAAWAQRWQLPVALPPDPLALSALRALRALLRRMLADLAAQQSVTEAHLADLNAFLALTPLVPQLERTPEGVRLVSRPLQAGGLGVVSQVALAWAELLSDTPLDRLKVCANPACQWVFLDQSHNRSRRWCRQWACGNLMKVRDFRARAQQSRRGGHESAAR